MKITLRLLTTLFLTAILSLAAFAQADKAAGDRNSAPIEWKRYKVLNGNISFSMPKKPSITHNSDACSQYIGRIYTAYAEQTVYQMSWRGKTEDPKPAFCRGVPPNDIPAYDKRIATLRESRDVESAFKFMGADGHTFKHETDAYVETISLIWVDGGMVEMTVNRRKNAASTGEDRFRNSLKLNDASAEDVGDGSPRMLGDFGEETTSSANSAIPNEPLAVRWKPRPGYTQIARQKGTSGTVVLRVEFLANGAIGAVTPIKELENGLTDQSVLAARNMAFLPARTNGVPVTVTKQIEYSFAIY
jgi:TonB family protein